VASRPVGLRGPMQVCACVSEEHGDGEAIPRINNKQIKDEERETDP